MNGYFVAVAGNIGVGKTTLTRLLSERFGWTALFEAEAENPYLEDFYQDMSAWAFHSQVFFLAHRLAHYHTLMRQPGSVIQDRSIYEDAEVFARNLYVQGVLSERDWQSYRALYEAVLPLLRPPDLVVYLQASVSTLTERIRQRGRAYERAIPEAYLAQLNELYESWIQSFRLCPVLTISADRMDFVRSPAYLDIIASRVLDRLSGREELRLE
ncbi:MAG: deoxynucleoside kinase [Anaerolineae bacterium]